MKNTLKILFQICIILMLTQICSASSPYPQLSGNPADPIWTIYLASATLNDNSLQSGDAIGIFDNNRLVGSFELTEVLSQDKQFNNFITVWSTLNDGSGYTGGNTYTIKKLRYLLNRILLYMLTIIQPQTAKRKRNEIRLMTMKIGQDYIKGKMYMSKRKLRCLYMEKLVTTGIVVVKHVQYG
jgi:hypothetical protein